MMSQGYAPRYGIERQDYSESDDAPSEQQTSPRRPPPDVTELFRRTRQEPIVAQPRNSGPYYHMPANRYYETQHYPCPAPPPPPPHTDPRYCCYNEYSSRPEEGSCFKAASASLSLVRHPVANKTASGATVTKKYPVTARIPRYYRPTSAMVHKRPSALCLPVITQPDPASYRRVKKPDLYQYEEDQHQEVVYCPNEPYSTVPPVKRALTRAIDSEGDVNSRLNELENLITKFDVDAEDNYDNHLNSKDEVQVNEISDVAKILKPRVPSSVKAKREKINRLKTVRLDDIELVAEDKKSPGDCPLDGNSATKPKSPKDLVSFDQIGTNRKARLDQKPPLDDTSALELHRSKSYIVSLIDKALSKELGTIPGDKCTRKDFLNMNPKRAINLVNRHTPQKTDEDRINFDQSISSNMAKKEDACACRMIPEESLYLKQLRQLRWSHLRHIQWEAKRLADLERFLDSFAEKEPFY